MRVFDKTGNDGTSPTKYRYFPFNERVVVETEKRTIRKNVTSQNVITLCLTMLLLGFINKFFNVINEKQKSNRLFSYDVKLNGYVFTCSYSEIFIRVNTLIKFPVYFLR